MFSERLKFNYGKTPDYVFHVVSAGFWSKDLISQLNQQGEIWGFNTFLSLFGLKGDWNSRTGKLVAMYVTSI